MFITSVSLFSIWQTVDTLDFCWLALFLALSAKTCFYEQNSHPEKTIPAITPPCNLDSFAEKCFHLRKTTWSWGNCTKSSLVFWNTKRKIGAIACSGDVWGVLACKSHRFAEMSKDLKEEAIIQWNCQHFSPLVHIYDDNDSNSVGIKIDNNDDNHKGSGNNSLPLSAFSTQGCTHHGPTFPTQSLKRTKFDDKQCICDLRFKIQDDHSGSVWGNLVLVTTNIDWFWKCSSLGYKWVMEEPKKRKSRNYNG